MKSRVLDAVKRHKDGYNCCQAVICTYSDLLKMDEVTLFKVSEGLGAGISKKFSTCGACTAMILAASLLNSDGNIKNPTTKASTYNLGYELIEKFETMNKSSICRDLKGMDTKEMLRSCSGCVMDAAIIIEEELFKGIFDKFEGSRDI